MKLQTITEATVLVGSEATTASAFVFYVCQSSLKSKRQALEGPSFRNDSAITSGTRWGSVLAEQTVLNRDESHCNVEDQCMLLAHRLPDHRCRVCTGTRAGALGFLSASDQC